MGYPMDYRRVVSRNHLEGGYEGGLVQGDMRRLEIDSVDEYNSGRIAEAAGTTPETVRAVLKEFFYCGRYGWDETSYGTPHPPIPFVGDGL